MKVQIHRQTLRFRVSEEESTRLLKYGFIESETQLTSDLQLAHRIELHDALQPEWKCMATAWILALPYSEIQAHLQRLPSRNGLQWKIETDATPLVITFEVDVHDRLRQRLRGKTRVLIQETSP